MQLKMEKKKKFNRVEIRNSLCKESKFISNLLSLVSIPSHDFDEIRDDVFVGKEKPSKEEARNIQRAKSYQDLSNRLTKLKGTNDFSLKNKLMKKSLSRRLKKKTQKEERNMKKKMVKMKKREKGQAVKSEPTEQPATQPTARPGKPVFNSQGKMVFSKFDFTESGMNDDRKKGERDPKRILENLQKQKEAVKELRDAGETEKAAVMLEKISWKNALAKAEGQKIKDDPILLQKSVKKMEQKKKSSSKKWDQRLQGVEKAKEDRQKKRTTNINKRKQDMKKKVMKKAVKKGRMIP